MGNKVPFIPNRVLPPMTIVLSALRTRLRSRPGSAMMFSASKLVLILSNNARIFTSSVANIFMCPVLFKQASCPILFQKS